MEGGTEIEATAPSTPPPPPPLLNRPRTHFPAVGRSVGLLCRHRERGADSDLGGAGNSRFSTATTQKVSQYCDDQLSERHGTARHGRGGVNGRRGRVDHETMMNEEFRQRLGPDDRPVDRLSEPHQLGSRWIEQKRTRHLSPVL